MQPNRPIPEFIRGLVRRSWIILLMASLMAFSPIVIPPECRINASAWSDSILLVEITKVTLTDEKVADGIGCREISVEGTVIEVIRGGQKSKTFRSSKNLVRVVDAKVVEASRGAGALDVLLSAQNDQTGIVD